MLLQGFGHSGPAERDKTFMGGLRQHRDLHGSVEIALTADVAVAQGLVVGRLVEKSAIKAVLEDRTDRGDGAGLDEDAASAGCIDARIVVASGQRQDAEAGAKALLGMGRATLPARKDVWLVRQFS